MVIKNYKMLGKKINKYQVKIIPVLKNYILV